MVVESTSAVLNVENSNISYAGVGWGVSGERIGVWVNGYLEARNSIFS